ncbi:hypothetical protein BDZ97DRAFT_1154452 [Flammula alnicola]|nr:hypothetical protein BDZ97DRAFT_1154452 [Flammula alnicola]
MSSRSEISTPKPSPKDIKQRLRRMPELCSNCHVEEHAGFKRCVNSLYCSKDCQKAHWPQHKTTCRLSTATGNDIDIVKFAQILMANTTLRRYMEILLVLELDLLNNPSRASEIFKAQIIIDFEPSRIQDFLSLFNRSAIIDSSPLLGMLQICAISSEKEVPFDSITIKDVEKRRDEEVLLRKEPVQMGIIQWIRNVGEYVSVSNGVGIITKESIEIARQATYLEIPTFSRGVAIIKKPASKTTYIELINALIRQDTKNRWLLRIK